MLFDESLSFTSIRQYTVYDVKKIAIGKIIDYTVHIKENRVKKFILGGTYLEELRENLGLKPDDDPVVPLDLIERMDGYKIYLKVNGSNLKSKLEDEAINPEEKLFTEINGKSAYSKNKTNLGKIKDGIIDRDRSHKFIIQMDSGPKRRREIQGLEIKEYSEQGIILKY